MSPREEKIPIKILPEDHIYRRSSPFPSFLGGFSLRIRTNAIGTNPLSAIYLIWGCGLSKSYGHAVT